MKKLGAKGLLLFVLFLLPKLVFSQGPPPPPPPGLPIDGGVFLLALAGLYYGFKKLK